MEKIGCIILIFKENQRPSRYIERQRPCKKKGIFAQWVIFRLFAWSVLTCPIEPYKFKIVPDSGNRLFHTRSGYFHQTRLHSHESHELHTVLSINNIRRFGMIATARTRYACDPIFRSLLKTHGKMPLFSKYSTSTTVSRRAVTKNLT
jgi:hypothetical protein